MKNLAIAVWLAVAALLIAAVITSDSESETKYLDTERGLMSYQDGYCVLGVVVSNDRINIYGPDGKVITCKGYITLTDTEFDNYEL